MVTIFANKGKNF
ncbi:hypothetical protein MKD33_03045, partial [Chromobacterium piscinae]